MIRARGKTWVLLGVLFTILRRSVGSMSNFLCGANDFDTLMHYRELTVDEHTIRNDTVSICTSRQQQHFQKSSSPQPRSEVLHLLHMYRREAFSLQRLCTVESYLKTNIHGVIHFHVPDKRAFEYTLSTTSMSFLLSNERFVVREEDLVHRFKGTVFADWFRTVRVKHSTQPQGVLFYHQHVSDALRLAILYQEGGTYMDLDFFVNEDISRISPNALVLEDDTMINNAFLRFEKGHPYLALAMAFYVKRFKPKWGWNSPVLVTTTYYHYCQNLITNNCGAAPIEVLAKERTHPISWRDVVAFEARRRSDVSESQLQLLNNATIIHWYNHMFKKSSFRNDSVFSDFSSRLCPVTRPFHGVM